MFRKFLLSTACLCLLSAPMAMAGENSRQAASAGYTNGSAGSYGVCTRGTNGSGEVINWVKNEGQCRNSSNGQSWVENGIVIHNYQRGN